MSVLKKILRAAIPAVLLFGLGFALSEWLATSPRFDLSQIEFPRALREENNMPVVEIFFATNRETESGGAEFSQEAAESLSYGIAEVRIPERFRLTDVQRPEIPRGISDSERARILRVRPLTEADFQKTLRERLVESASVRATLFVHGIQNSFDSTIRQAGTGGVKFLL
jgi:esterase/lipase superfamily enzyme